MLVSPKLRLNVHTYSHDVHREILCCPLRLYKCVLLHPVSPSVLRRPEGRADARAVIKHIFRYETISVELAEHTLNLGIIRCESETCYVPPYCRESY